MTNEQCAAFAVAFYNTKPCGFESYSLGQQEQWLADRDEIKQLLHRYNADFDESRFDEISEQGYCLSEVT